MLFFIINVLNIVFLIRVAVIRLNAPVPDQDFLFWKLNIDLYENYCVSLHVQYRDGYGMCGKITQPNKLNLS